MIENIILKICKNMCWFDAVFLSEIVFVQKKNAYLIAFIMIWMSF